MRALAWLGAVGLFVLAAACEGDPRATPEDESVGRGFGEPCVVSEDCASGLCVRTTAFRGVCTHLCDSDVGCPTSPSWGCVQPADFDLSVCGCVADAPAEICGDGLDNDCNGESDDCRLCFGVPVPVDDPDHCGECGNACRADQRCRDGECVCDAIGTTECSGACVDLDVDERHCGACDTACGLDQVCRAGECLCPDSAAPDHCAGVGCVDLSSDDASCGACGDACGGERECVAGSCRCPIEGETWCGDAAGCVATDTHESHCGSCGTACDGGQVCLDGSCDCPVDWPDRCDGVCVDTRDDAANCGGCGNECPTGTVCTDGSCQCPITGWERCGGTCVDVASDEAHCGSCGTACVTGEVCSAGACACLSGLYCGGECVSSSDTSNCGGCGVTCGSTQYCSGGTCRCSSSSLTACGTACVDTDDDESHCGGCGITCRTGEMCSYGSCVCPYGQTWCAAAGTCVDTSTSTEHCGACDNACNPTEACSSGACACPTYGETYCASVGACTNTWSNTSHCGGCDVACNPTEVCSSGSCRCSSYYQQYCASATACVDLRSSDDHCGACDAACPSDATCVSSACECSDPSLTACPDVPACVDLQTDVAHCGACDVSCATGRECDLGLCVCPPPTSTTEVRLTDDAVHETAPQVASNGDRLGIVWKREGRCWFQLLEGDGTPVAGTLQQVGPEYPGNTLDIVWNGTEWVVFYHATVSGSWHLLYQRFDTSGSAVGSPTDVTAASTVAMSIGPMEIAYSPVSGYAAGGRDFFQYLGPTATSPGPQVSYYPSPETAAIAGSPVTGEWAALVSDYPDRTRFYQFTADGTLTGTPTDLGSRPICYFNDDELTLTHDGVTWVAAAKHEAYVAPDTYLDQILLLRGPTLGAETLVRSVPRLEEYGDPRIQRITVDYRGGQTLVSWTENQLGTYEPRILARRFDAPSSATVAATPLDAAHALVSTHSVVQVGHDARWTGPGRYTGVWVDERHADPYDSSGRELYAASVDVSHCP